MQEKMYGQTFGKYDPTKVCDPTMEQVAQLKAYKEGLKVTTNEPCNARIGEVAEEIGKSEKLLNVLHEKISHLEDIIRFILKSSCPGTVAPEKNVGPSCELSGILRQQNESISGACWHIQDIIDRCEL
jgi:hypothetical protein